MNKKLRFRDKYSKEFPPLENKRLKDIVTKEGSLLTLNTLKDNIGNYNLYGAAGLFKKIDSYQKDRPYITIVNVGTSGKIAMREAYSSVLSTVDMIQEKEGNNLYFVYCILQKTNFKRYIQGSIMANLYFRNYGQIKVQAPSYEEQNKIGNALKVVEEKITLLQEQLENVKKYKRGLLQTLIGDVI